MESNGTDTIFSQLVGLSHIPCVGDLFYLPNYTLFEVKVVEYRTISKERPEVTVVAWRADPYELGVDFYYEERKVSGFEDRVAQRLRDEASQPSEVKR
jgi:hypothetical protein